MNDTLLLLRYFMNATVTMGVMTLGPTLYLQTLELPKLYAGEENVPFKCCIPAGKYILEMLDSPKHGKALPHVLGVPGRSAIELHAGNTVRDVEGCGVVGEVSDVACECVGRSVPALNQLLLAMAQYNPGHIEVRDYVW